MVSGNAQSNIREPPPQLVPLSSPQVARSSSGFRAPKECPEAEMSHLWELTSNVLSTTAEFGTTEELEDYLMEAEDPIGPPAKYVHLLNHLNILVLVLILFAIGKQRLDVHLFTSNTTTLLHCGSLQHAMSWAWGRQDTANWSKCYRVQNLMRNRLPHLITWHER